MGAPEIVFALEGQPKTESKTIQNDRKIIKIQKKQKKWSQRGSKREPEERKGIKMEPEAAEKRAKKGAKGRQREVKRSQGAPKGGKRMPKGSPQAIKIHPRIGLGARVEKRSQKG